MLQRISSVSKEIVRSFSESKEGVRYQKKSHRLVCIAACLLLLSPRYGDGEKYLNTSIDIEIERP